MEMEACPSIYLGCDVPWRDRENEVSYLPKGRGRSRAYNARYASCVSVRDINCERYRNGAWCEREMSPAILSLGEMLMQERK